MAIAAAACLLAGGCGGFSASHGVSPATFLLPGVVQNQQRAHPPAAAPGAGATGGTLAQARPVAALGQAW